MSNNNEHKWWNPGETNDMTDWDMIKADVQHGYKRQSSMDPNKYSWVKNIGRKRRSLLNKVGLWFKFLIKSKPMETLIIREYEHGLRITYVDGVNDCDKFISQQAPQPKEELKVEKDIHFNKGNPTPINDSITKMQVELNSKGLNSKW